MKKIPNLVTIEDLIEAEACDRAMTLFMTKFPNGIELTLENVRKVLYIPALSISYFLIDYIDALKGRIDKGLLDELNALRHDLCCTECYKGHDQAQEIYDFILRINNLIETENEKAESKT